MSPDGSQRRRNFLRSVGVPVTACEGRSRSDGPLQTAQKKGVLADRHCSLEPLVQPSVDRHAVNEGTTSSSTSARRISLANQMAGFAVISANHLSGPKKYRSGAFSLQFRSGHAVILARLQGAQVIAVAPGCQQPRNVPGGTRSVLANPPGMMVNITRMPADAATRQHGHDDDHRRRKQRQGEVGKPTLAMGAEFPGMSGRLLPDRVGCWDAASVRRSTRPTNQSRPLPGTGLGSTTATRRRRGIAPGGHTATKARPPRSRVGGVGPDRRASGDSAQASGPSSRAPHGGGRHRR